MSKAKKNSKPLDTLYVYGADGEFPNGGWLSAHSDLNQLLKAFDTENGDLVAVYQLVGMKKVVKKEPALIDI